MKQVEITELIKYLRENIEDYDERIALAIIEGYRQNISPSKVNRFLMEDIKDVAYEYAVDNLILEEDMEEFLDTYIDNIYFES